MTAMYDGWSPSLEHLTAGRFLFSHRNGRRAWCCPRDGHACRFLTWALDYQQKHTQPPSVAILLNMARPVDDGPLQ